MRQSKMILSHCATWYKQNIAKCLKAVPHHWDEVHDFQDYLGWELHAILNGCGRHKSRCKLWNTIQHFFSPSIFFSQISVNNLKILDAASGPIWAVFIAPRTVQSASVDEGNCPSPTLSITRMSFPDNWMACWVRPSVNKADFFQSILGACTWPGHQDTSRVDEWPFISEVLRPEAITNKHWGVFA